jgi:hypothetical protein
MLEIEYIARASDSCQRDTACIKPLKEATPGSAHTTARVLLPADCYWGVAVIMNQQARSLHPFREETHTVLGQ